MVRSTATQRQPHVPHSNEAERTTLGALLLDPDTMIDVAPILTPRDFYDPVHAAIYGAIQRLYEERTPIDFVTVSDALIDHPQLRSVGGSAFLAELAAAVPTSSYATHYAEIVREKSLRRRLAKVAGTIADLAIADGKTSAELLELAERQVLELSRQSPQSKPRLLVDITPERYEHYTALYEAGGAVESQGITKGFAGLDGLLTTLRPGHLMILAGRPSIGKSALALNIARNVAVQQRKAVTIFSLEMTTAEVADRLLAGLLGVDAWRLRRGDLSEQQYQQMGAEFDRLAGCRLFIDDDPDATLTNLRSKARRQQIERGIDLLIIDYLQLIQVTDRAAAENQTQRVTYISNGLKQLARELACPVIVLSQLSRSCDQRTDKRPILSDLRDSGSIEQDADSVLMLYRESYYNEDCNDPDVTDVYVRKNRHGPTGRVSLHFDHEKMSFRSC